MKNNPIFSFLDSANRRQAFAVRVGFPFPLRGFNYGYLTGRRVELLHEISLPNGDFVYLYSYEYSIEPNENREDDRKTA